MRLITIRANSDPEIFAERWQYRIMRIDPEEDDLEIAAQQQQEAREEAARKAAPEANRINVR